MGEYGIRPEVKIPEVKIEPVDQQEAGMPTLTASEALEQFHNIGEPGDLKSLKGQIDYATRYLTSNPPPQEQADFSAEIGKWAAAHQSPELLKRAITTFKLNTPIGDIRHDVLDGLLKKIKIPDTTQGTDSFSSASSRATSGRSTFAALDVPTAGKRTEASSQELRTKAILSTVDASQAYEEKYGSLLTDKGMEVLESRRQRSIDEGYIPQRRGIGPQISYSKQASALAGSSAAQQAALQTQQQQSDISDAPPEQMTNSSQNIDQSENLITSSRFDAKTHFLTEENGNLTVTTDKSKAMSTEDALAALQSHAANGDLSSEQLTKLSRNVDAIYANRSGFFKKIGDFFGLTARSKAYKETMTKLNTLKDVAAYAESLGGQLELNNDQVAGLKDLFNYLPESKQIIEDAVQAINQEGVTPEERTQIVTSAFAQMAEPLGNLSVPEGQGGIGEEAFKLINLLPVLSEKLSQTRSNHQYENDWSGSEISINEKGGKRQIGQFNMGRELRSANPMLDTIASHIETQMTTSGMSPAELSNKVSSYIVEKFTKDGTERGLDEGAARARAEADLSAMKGFRWTKMGSYDGKEGLGHADWHVETDSDGNVVSAKRTQALITGDGKYAFEAADKSAIEDLGPLTAKQFEGFKLLHEIAGQDQTSGEPSKLEELRAKLQKNIDKNPSYFAGLDPKKLINAAIDSQKDSMDRTNRLNANMTQWNGSEKTNA